MTDPTAWEEAAENWLYRAMASAAGAGKGLDQTSWGVDPKTVSLWARKPADWAPPLTSLLKLCRSPGYPALALGAKRRLGIELFTRGMLERRPRREVAALALLVLEAAPDDVLEAFSTRLRA